MLNARVVVVGSGGLGVHIIELLARQGLGFMRLIDGDSSTVLNLNRQLLATERTMGMNKAAVAEVNCEVETHAVPAMFDEDNGVELLSGMDVVIDALDSINCRLLLCRVAQGPMTERGRRNKPDREETEEKCLSQDENSPGSARDMGGTDWCAAHS